MKYSVVVDLEWIHTCRLRSTLIFISSHNCWDVQQLCIFFQLSPCLLWHCIPAYTMVIPCAVPQYAAICQMDIHVPSARKTLSEMSLITQKTVTTSERYTSWQRSGKTASPFYPEESFNSQFRHPRETAPWDCRTSWWPSKPSWSSCSEVAVLGSPAA